MCDSHFDGLRSRWGLTDLVHLLIKIIILSIFNVFFNMRIVILLVNTLDVFPAVVVEFPEANQLVSWKTKIQDVLFGTGNKQPTHFLDPYQDGAVDFNNLQSLVLSTQSAVVSRMEENEEVHRIELHQMEVKAAINHLLESTNVPGHPELINWIKTDLALVCTPTLTERWHQTAFYNHRASRQLYFEPFLLAWQLRNMPPELLVEPNEDGVPFNIAELMSEIKSIDWSTPSTYFNLFQYEYVLAIIETAQDHPIFKNDACIYPVTTRQLHRFCGKKTTLFSIALSSQNEMILQALLNRLDVSSLPSTLLQENTGWLIEVLKLGSKSLDEAKRVYGITTAIIDTLSNNLTTDEIHAALPRGLIHEFIGFCNVACPAQFEIAFEALQHMTDKFNLTPDHFALEHHRVIPSLTVFPPSPENHHQRTSSILNATLNRCLSLYLPGSLLDNVDLDHLLDDSLMEWEWQDERFEEFVESSDLMLIEFMVNHTTNEDITRCCIPEKLQMILSFDILFTSHPREIVFQAESSQGVPSISKFVKRNWLSE